MHTRRKIVVLLLVAVVSLAIYFVLHQKGKQGSACKVDTDCQGGLTCDPQTKTCAVIHLQPPPPIIKTSSTFMVISIIFLLLLFGALFALYRSDTNYKEKIRGMEGDLGKLTHYYKVNLDKLHKESEAREEFVTDVSNLHDVEKEAFQKMYNEIQEERDKLKNERDALLQSYDTHSDAYQGVYNTIQQGLANLAKPNYGELPQNSNEEFAPYHT